jgi:hypothetical protein
MDCVWKDAGFELGMNCYNAISTGDEEGFIQVGK